MSSSAASLAPSYSPTSALKTSRPTGGLAGMPDYRTEGSSARAAHPLHEQEKKPERLRVVEGERGALRRSAWPFVLLALVIAVVAIVIPLVANTQMAQRSYDIRDLQIQLAELDAQTSSLEAALLEASSPETLEKKARDLGLVPAQSPGVISLDEGTVEGGTAAW